MRRYATHNILVSKLKVKVIKDDKAQAIAVILPEAMQPCHAA